MRTTAMTLLAAVAMNAAIAADLPRGTPEEQGVASSAILEFIRAADAQANSMHSFMMVRHGRVIAEGWWAPYNPASPHVLFSLSKSFTSTAVGMAIEEGKFSIDDEVLKFFPEDAPNQPSRNLKAMRVRDLLRMNTGHLTEPPRPEGQSWKRAFLHHPVELKPSTHFLYNTPATYMLSAIVEKTAGTPLLDYLQPRLLEPLGIQNATWDKSPEGITLGGYGLSVRTEDIAKFGELYLRKGQWNGKRLIPEHWVEQATGFQTANGSNPKSDWEQGYGYQFWRCRHNFYRGDGAFGQYCIVMPEQDVVIAITSGLGNMQLPMDLIWDKLLPGIRPNTLPPDETAHSKLVETLNSLSLPPQDGKSSGAGALGRSFALEENSRNWRELAITAGEKGATLIRLRTADGEDKIECGNGQWIRGEVKVDGKPQRVASSGGWTSPDTFKAKLCLYETPFVFTWELKFTGDELEFIREANVAFGSTKEPTIKGKVASGQGG